MARHVARELVKLGGRPGGEGAVTDNGNIILDVSPPDRLPRDLEERINNIPGVVTNGLCPRPADRLLVAGPNGVETGERG